MDQLNVQKLLEKHQFKPEIGQPRFLDEPNLNFPESIKRYKIVMESFGMSIEEPYFWILNMLREGLQFVDITKLKDVFTATETSDFFGLVGQRLQIQQSQAMQYLAQIGIFVKQLFSMIRELKTIDMRLEMYRESNKIYRDKEIEEKQSINYDRPESHSAEIALKNLWIELIDGGMKNPSSVFGLAREVGYMNLPDLFFDNPAKSTKDVDAKVDILEYNEKVKRVLKSKLFSYFTWKEKSFKEYVDRRKFMIKYLRQHYEIIKTYMNWVRPYLVHAKRLGSDLNRLKSPDLIGAFEQSMIEIEFLAKKKGKKYNRCILAHFLFKTRPALEYHKEGYQHKGAIHVGRAEISLRGYTWTDEQVKEFEKLRDDEDFELIGSIDASIKSAMDMLRDDLKIYLKEALEEFKEDKKSKTPEPQPPEKGLFEPFIELAKASISPIKVITEGFAELLGRPISTPKTSSGKPQTKAEIEIEETDKTKAKKEVQKALFIVYNIFKKAHLMPAF